VTLISASKLAEPLNDKTGAPATSVNQRRSGRNVRGILPGLFLTSIVAGVSFAVRMLPGMTTFSPMMLSMVVGMAFYNIIGMAARAKQGVTFSLRRLLRIAIVLLGLHLTSSQIIEIGGRGLRIIAATVLATFAFSVWMGKLLGVEPKLAQLIAAGTSICGASAIATKLGAKGFRPALLGGFAFLIVGFSPTLIKLME